MRILISGICGFVGNSLARALAKSDSSHSVSGFDNFIRPGSETNRTELKRLGIRVFHCDLRAASDIDALPACQWLIDAAANPSVLAGVDGKMSSRQLVEHNLGGTLNLLEYCKRHRAGFILLSSSRVYSVEPLSALAVVEEKGAFRPVFTERADEGAIPRGVTAKGIDENFPTTAPISLYGASKLASETLALEYGETFDLPIFVNRCGILAGAGQFGRPDQGIFAYWINSWLRRRPLKYIGFNGLGHQVRDCLHPRDLMPLLEKQMQSPELKTPERIVNLGGGGASATSLRQLSDWCSAKFGPHAVGSDLSLRQFDVPWLVLDTAKATRLWSWKPEIAVAAILDEIAVHAQAHPDWLELSARL